MSIFPPLFLPFLPMEHQPLGITNVPGNQLDGAAEGLGQEGVWTSQLARLGTGCLNPAWSVAQAHQAGTGDSAAFGRAEG